LVESLNLISTTTEVHARMQLEGTTDLSRRALINEDFPLPVEPITPMKTRGPSRAWSSIDAMKTR